MEVMQKAEPLGIPEQRQGGSVGMGVCVEWMICNTYVKLTKQQQHQKQPDKRHQQQKNPNIMTKIKLHDCILLTELNIFVFYGLQYGIQV